MVRFITALLALISIAMTIVLFMSINDQPEWLKWSAFGWLFLSMLWMWKVGLKGMWNQEETSWEAARVQEGKLVRYSSYPGRRG